MICLVLNAVGLGSSFLETKQWMYVIFGLSTLVFYRRYAVLSWKIFYERFVGNAERVDAAITNEVVSAFCLICGYIFIYQKLGMICILFPILQALIFGVQSMVRTNDKKKVMITLGHLAELAVGITLCL